MILAIVVGVLAASGGGLGIGVFGFTPIGYVCILIASSVGAVLVLLLVNASSNAGQHALARVINESLDQ